MAKKTKTRTATKKVVRAPRKAAAQRPSTDGDGLGKIIDSIQKQTERENVKQAALRIVKEAAERN